MRFLSLFFIYLLLLIYKHLNPYNMHCCISFGLCREFKIPMVSLIATAQQQQHMLYTTRIFALCCTFAALKIYPKFELYLLFYFRIYESHCAKRGAIGYFKNPSYRIQNARSARKEKRSLFQFSQHNSTQQRQHHRAVIRLQSAWKVVQCFCVHNNIGEK